MLQNGVLHLFGGARGWLRSYHSCHIAQYGATSRPEWWDLNVDAHSSSNKEGQLADFRQHHKQDLNCLSVFPFPKFFRWRDIFQVSSCMLEHPQLKAVPSLKGAFRMCAFCKSPTVWAVFWEDSDSTARRPWYFCESSVIQMGGVWHTSWWCSRACFCKSIAIQMGAVSRCSFTASRPGVDLTFLNVSLKVTPKRKWFDSIPKTWPPEPCAEIVWSKPGIKSYPMAIGNTIRTKIIAN